MRSVLGYMMRNGRRRRRKRDSRESWSDSRQRRRSVVASRRRKRRRSAVAVVTEDRGKTRSKRSPSSLLRTLLSRKPSLWKSILNSNLNSLLKRLRRKCLRAPNLFVVVVLLFVSCLLQYCVPCQQSFLHYSHRKWISAKCSVLS